MGRLLDEHQLLWKEGEDMTRALNTRCREAEPSQKELRSGVFCPLI